MNTVKKNYGIDGKSLGKTGLFYLENEKVALNASLNKRFWARLFDLVISSFVGTTIFMSFYYSSIITPNIANVMKTNISSPQVWTDVWYQFDHFMHTAYHPMFVVANALTIFFSIGFNILIPIFNPKRKGQSLGKTMLGITPVFEEGVNKNIAIIKRELPISILQSTMVLSTILTGFNISFVTLQYRQWSKVMEQSISPYFNLYAVQAMNLPVYTNSWNFIIHISTNKEFMGTVAFDTFQQSMAFSYNLIQIMYSISLMVIFISIMFANNKRGLHDKFAKTSVIDLRTLQKRETYELLVENEQEATMVEKIKEEFPIKLKLNDKSK